MQKKTKDVVWKGVWKTGERARLRKINKKDEKAESAWAGNFLEIPKEDAFVREFGTYLWKRKREDRCQDSQESGSFWFAFQVHWPERQDYSECYTFKWSQATWKSWFQAAISSK